MSQSRSTHRPKEGLMTKLKRAELSCFQGLTSWFRPIRPHQLPLYYFSKIPKCVLCISKTYLYNFDPLKSHLYIVKLGFTGVYILFLISAQKHKLWVLVRTASARRFQRVPTIYVLSRNMKNIRFFIWKFSLYFNILYLNRRVFVMWSQRARYYKLRYNEIQGEVLRLP